MDYNIHKIDCIEYMKSLPDKSIDCIITDPPYLYLEHRLDRPFDEEAYFKQVKRVLKKEHTLAFFGRGSSFYRWNYICEALGLKFKEELIWDKGSSTTPCLAIGRQHENIAIYSTRRLNSFAEPRTTRLFEDDYLDKIYDDIRNVENLTYEDLQTFKNGLVEYSQERKQGVTVGAKSMNCERRFTTLKFLTQGMKGASVVRISKNNGNQGQLHPTQKPLELMQILVEICSNKGEVVLDTFMGSASTGVASLIKGRRFIGTEIDEEFFATSQRRLEEYGNKYHLAGYFTKIA